MDIYRFRNTAYPRETSGNLLGKGCSTFVYLVTSVRHLLVNQDRHNRAVRNPAWQILAKTTMKWVFTDLKTQVLVRCGQNISWKSARNHMY